MDKLSFKQLRQSRGLKRYLESKFRPLNLSATTRFVFSQQYDAKNDI